MSQILRALNRARHPRGGGDRKPERDDSAVLAGLGVRSNKEVRSRQNPVLWVLIGVGLLAISGVVAINALRDRSATQGPGARPVQNAQLLKPADPPTATEPSLTAPPVPENETAATNADAPPPVSRAARSVGVPVETNDSSARPRAASSARLPAASSIVPPEPDAAPSKTAAGGNVDHFKMALYYHQNNDFENALFHYGALLQRDPMNAEAHNNLGLLYKQKKLFDEAIAEFKRALSIDAKYVVARNNLGAVLLEAGQPDAAAAQLRTIIAADPENVDALVNLALAQSALKQSGAAQETLMRAIGIEPRHAVAHYNLARLYEDERESAKAIDHYRAFLQYAGPEHGAIIPEVNRRVAALQKEGG